LPADYYRELTRLLRDAGCEFRRQAKGSHEIWYSPISGRTFTVPHPTKRRATANNVLKDAGLPKSL
jgi:predicted RNA binding protein YcfA (HicA-like mRNA interferase family)